MTTIHHSHPRPDPEGRVMSPIDVAYGALLEVGRRDLAECIVWFDEDGGYIEVLDDLSAEDTAIIDKAENLARASAAPVAIGAGGVRPTQAKGLVR